MFALLVGSAVAGPPELGVRPVNELELHLELQRKTERVRVVNFLATWCKPCTSELPVLHTVLAAWPTVEPLYVSLDEVRDGPAVLAYATQHRLLGRTLHLQASAPENAIARVVENWPDSIPLTLVLRTDGTEAARFRGVLAPVELDAALRLAGATR